MARNTQSVLTTTPHPSFTEGGWNASLDHEADRTLLNWLGCGVRPPAGAGCSQNRSSSVHSLVLEPTGKEEPQDGLQAKFSVYHGCAAGLIFGRAAEEEFADAIVTRDDVVALRRKVVATVDDTIFEASADVTAILKNGQRVHVFVKNAIGSLENPLTDAMLEAKFHGMCDAVVGASRCGGFIGDCQCQRRAVQGRSTRLKFEKKRP